MNKLLFSILFVLLLASNVYALGITPARAPVDYSAGLEKDIVFTVINSEHKDMDLSISVQGEMSSGVILEKDRVHVSADDGEIKVNAKFKVPEGLTPGKHDANIVFSQIPESQGSSGGASVQAVLAVTSQISLYVPYPGKYLEGELKVSGTGKEKTFVISMLNRGKDNIGKVSASIHIYDSSEKEVRVLKTNEISLNSPGSGEVNALWNSDVPEGKYHAKAVVNYDGQEILFESPFEVGELVLDLQQIVVKDFTLGGIAKFDMIVMNKWNEPITQAYAEMRVYDDNMKEIVSMKSSTYDIPAGMQTTMNYYWDTKGVSEGLYNSNIILYYSGKKTQQDLKLDVKSDRIDVTGLGYVISSETSSGSGGMINILIIVVVILVLINVLWFLAWRKKKVGQLKS
ncbi:MAG: hypothetical protein AABX11_03815 [Nanoarchaeota archaeon]